MKHILPICQLGSAFVGCIHHPDVRTTGWGEGSTNWPESLLEQAQVWQHGHQVSEGSDIW